MPWDDLMFKTFPGNHHPFEDTKKQVDESRVNEAIAKRDGANWTDEEIVVVMFATPPTTTDEIAQQLEREPGAIHAVKTFVCKAILKPSQYQEADGSIKSRYGIMKRIYRLVEEHGIRKWPLEAQQTIATALPGTKTRHRRKAAYMARQFHCS